MRLGNGRKLSLSCGLFLYGPGSTSDECPVNMAARFEHVTSGRRGDAGVGCGFAESGTGQGAGGAKF